MIDEKVAKYLKEEVFRTYLILDSALHQRHECGECKSYRRATETSVLQGSECSTSLIKSGKRVIS